MEVLKKKNNKKKTNEIRVILKIYRIITFVCIYMYIHYIYISLL